MKKLYYYQILILPLFSVLLGCRANLLMLEDMLPSAKQQDFDVSFHQPSLLDFEVNFNLTYEISNPYKKDLPIPRHAMGIFVDGKDIEMSWDHNEVSVPAKSSLILKYPFTLNSNQIKNLLGKDNKITFKTNIELDLTDYTDMLPNFQLAVTEDFDIESSKMNPFINNLLEKRIGKFNFSYEHSTQVKLPKPPKISKSVEPIEIKLLGVGNSLINPNAIKNAMLPFGDLLITGELDGLKDPFIDKVVGLTVKVPDPLPLKWDNTKDVKLENFMLDLLRNFDTGIDDKWENTKTLLYRDQSFPVTTYFVDNFLQGKIDNYASNKWDAFQVAYEEFKTTVFPTQIPGPQTRGFEIYIPFIFKNQNEFPISIPIFRSSVIMSGGNPFSMYIKPKSMGEIALGEVPSNQTQIAGNSEETMYVVFSFDMKAFNHGIYSLFMKNQFEPNLGGVMSYDFGYGPLYIGYDLNKMSLDYK
ncbi:hypothetical protein SAMN00777080_4392 [Aquiflexum balticum DSM 16537]|uniref:Uncharacterized protein n=1 Tax=Aquiflexum balticum DSM 16537 TaxID=758820 RepID=A0A1W2HA11_9BACT|nr:hypothetical protein [Aquiflexum balticum]SMD45729.1 hypothetical protein SAMN00777080_4392 [Aquiflexum balticum DSM 16537]